MSSGYANTIAYCLYPARSKRLAPLDSLRQFSIFKYCEQFVLCFVLVGLNQ
jgi:hypothetical protein